VSKTKSICPECNKEIEAELTLKDGKILITKKCKEHGIFTATHWQSSFVYNFTEEYDFFKHFKESQENKRAAGCPYTCESCTGHVSDTVIGVIDVTKECDLRCAICFSTFSDHIVDYEPTKQELIDILTFLSKETPNPPQSCFQVENRLERKDMHEIIAAAHELKIHDDSGDKRHPYC
jgi:uncharacterized radical SAM superfamily Fe-S cluster-containing enzyme